MNKNFRILIVQFANLKDLQEFYKHEFMLKDKFIEYNIRINYRISDKNKITLEGYNRTIKHITNEFTFNNINKIFSLIDNINVYPRHTNNRKYNNLCNLPNMDKTSHCFNDITHHTCCLLGPRSREYSNASGNPIGKVSEDMFEVYFGRRPRDEDLTPWCTCIGSKVCSFYAREFNDGTHIKFINNNGIIIHNFDNPECENYIVNKYNFYKHTTPGVTLREKINNNKCNNFKSFNYN